jgi:uncharacterized membrane protein
VLVAGIAALWLLSAWPLGAGAERNATPAPEDGRPVELADVVAVIRKRCTVCHSTSPAIRTFGTPPVGVAFDTPEQMRQLAPRIRARAVETQTMPPGNATFMTEDERALLARWLDAEGL